MPIADYLTLSFDPDGALGVSRLWHVEIRSSQYLRFTPSTPIQGKGADVADDIADWLDRYYSEFQKPSIVALLTSSESETQFRIEWDRENRKWLKIREARKPL